MKHIKKFEEFVNENKQTVAINEAAGIGSDVKDFMDDQFEKYQKFLKKMFVGKSVNCYSMKEKGRDKSWQNHDILGIKDIKTDTSNYGKFSVSDENGEWYYIDSDMDSSDCKYIK